MPVEATCDKCGYTTVDIICEDCHESKINQVDELENQVNSLEDDKLDLEDTVNELEKMINSLQIQIMELKL